jgi:hypothetical protein
MTKNSINLPILKTGTTLYRIRTDVQVNNTIITAQAIVFSYLLDANHEKEQWYRKENYSVHSLGCTALSINTRVVVLTPV